MCNYYAIFCTARMHLNYHFLSIFLLGVAVTIYYFINNLLLYISIDSSDAYISRVFKS